jgi:23S rRNA (uracil1939-C5)-methyltransferase
MDILLSPGQLLPGLIVEKPATGGRMIARANGQIVMVGGAIPGEQVTARIERIGKGVVFATVVDVERASPDRREFGADPSCGGCLYGHVRHARQIDLKAQVIADAFARVRIGLPGPVRVAASPEEGYRMRARFHVRGGRLGFFREGTHEICDARATRQLLPASCAAVERLHAGVRSLGIDAVTDIELSENVEASQRVLHIETSAAVRPDLLTSLAPLEEVTGLTISAQTAVAPPALPVVVVGGSPYVSDTVSVHQGAVQLRRHVLSFFQANRYLLGRLLSSVLDQIDEGADVVDLYAGVGLFSVAAASLRRATVRAVEGDRASSLDLEANAASAGATVAVLPLAVERFVARRHEAPDVVIVDPPRTGMSRRALEGVIALGAPRLVYVSCDVATLARDARRLIDGRYEVRQIEGFDLFPNTPHVETVVVFDRGAATPKSTRPRRRIPRRVP